MDFCDNHTMYRMFTIKNFDGVESQVSLYKIFVPILLVGCLLSLVLNAVLVAVGTMSRGSIRSRSPILVLSLNLAATDAMASFLMGIGLVLNSFLPVVLNIDMQSDQTSCMKLVFEILRLSSLIASAMHLLALALVHYKGIVNPLHYRSVIFCSQHRTRSIYLMSFICWFLPAVIFAAYFTSIPCQGFLTSSCRSELIVTFRFRVIVVVAFFIPLIFMFVLYIRIFVIIKQHQAQRALQRQQSCQISIRSHSTTNQTPNSQCQDSPRSHSQCTPLMAKNDSCRYSQCPPKLTTSTVLSNNKTPGGYVEDGAASDLPEQNTGNNCADTIGISSPLVNKNSQQFSSMMVTTQPKEKMAKTMLCKLESQSDNDMIEYDFDGKNGQNSCGTFLLMFNQGCCNRCMSTFKHRPNFALASQASSVLYCEASNPDQANESDVNKQQQQQHFVRDNSVRFVSNAPITRNQSLASSIRSKNYVTTQSQSMEGAPSVACTTGHAKALVTTLLILGTYLLCWMPAVIFFALTCVDHCPYPITYMNFRMRVIFSFVTNGLVILKAIVDPFIYTYRMKEMKVALNRCFSLVCPSFVMKLCPLSGTELNQRSFGQQSSISRSSVNIFRQSQISTSSYGRTAYGYYYHNQNYCHQPNGTEYSAVDPASPHRQAITRQFSQMSEQYAEH